MRNRLLLFKFIFVISFQLCSGQETTVVTDPTEDTTTITPEWTTTTENTTTTTPEWTTTTTENTTTTTPEWTTTTTENTTTTTPEWTTDEDFNTTTPEWTTVPNTTEFTTPAVPNDTTTSNMTSPRPTTLTPPYCLVQCNQTDRYGYSWSVCANSTGWTDCSDLIRNSSGVAFWRCSINGKFETPNPNVSYCRSSWIGDLEDKAENIEDFDEAEKIIEDLSDFTTNSTDTYFGHEIRSVTRLVGCVTSRSRGFNPAFSRLEEMVKRGVNLNSYLIQHRDPWTDLNVMDRSAISSDILESMDGVLFELTDAVLNATDYRQIFAMDNKTDLLSFLILAETFEKEKGEVNREYEFPAKEERKPKDSFIKLPEGWKDLIKEEKVNIAGMSIDPEYISFIMPGQYANLKESTSIDGDGKLINGRLISLSLSPPENEGCGNTRRSLISKYPKNALEGIRVEVTFHHDIEAWGTEQQDIHRKLHDGEKPRAVLGSAQCVYWDIDKNLWSSNGCKVLRSNRYETVCECSHLTSFAVLMDVHKYVGKELGLELLTLILCPVSVLTLALGITVLIYVNGLPRIRSLITTNLSMCLLVGNVLVLFVLDRYYFNMGEGVCVGAAMITHYIFLCAFMWMLVEGIQLYRMVVHVFEPGRSYIQHFGLMAYGSPLIIIAITATIGFLIGDRPYGGDRYCWLQGPYIWSFMGPVAIIVVLNTIVLFIALRKTYEVKHTKNMSSTFLMGRTKSSNKWFKGCISLTVILGLTWAVGFFSIMKGTSGIIFAYVFTILNASQGMFIFLFNCVMNDKVREFAKQKLSPLLPSLPSCGTRYSISLNAKDNKTKDGSFYGERQLYGTEKVILVRYITNVHLPKEPFTIPTAKIVHIHKHNPTRQRVGESLNVVDLVEAVNNFSIHSEKLSPQRTDLDESIPSPDYTPNLGNKQVSFDSSQSAYLIS